MVSPSGIPSESTGEALQGPRLAADSLLVRARLRRPSLLAKFSVLSLLVIVALGAGIGSVLQERIERRALDAATRLAETVTAVGLEPVLLLGDLEPYPTLSRLDALDE